MAKLKLSVMNTHNNNNNNNLWNDHVRVGRFVVVSVVFLSLLSDFIRVYVFGLVFSCSLVCTDAIASCV